MIFTCLKIFLARITDVCLGTFRTVSIVKGNKSIAAIIAFVEVLIWYIIAREVLNPKLSSIFVPIAYAGGYAAGTYLGVILSSRFMGGSFTVSVISEKITVDNIKYLRKKGFNINILETADKKQMLIIQIKKTKLQELSSLINKFDSDSFIVVNDSKVYSDIKL